MERGAYYKEGVGREKERGKKEKKSRGWGLQSWEKGWGQEKEKRRSPCHWPLDMVCKADTHSNYEGIVSG